MYPLYWTTSKEGIADMLGYCKKTKDLSERSGESCFKTKDSCAIIAHVRISV